MLVLHREKQRGAKGLARVPTDAWGSEMEPKGPGYKVSAYSWLFSSVISDMVFVIE